ncbi:hypothetical protein N9772_00090 [Bacteroidia bacterium]|nr:hypothetical protein [Bacteroidia bacterium]
MKNSIFKKSILILVASLFSLTSMHATLAPNASHDGIDQVDRRVVVDGSITDSDGGKWSYKGWVEVGGWPLGLQHWDLWITLPDGSKYHFEGVAYDGGGSGDNGGPRPLGYKSHLYDQTGDEVSLNLIPWGPIIQDIEATINRSEL